MMNSHRIRIKAIVGLILFSTINGISLEGQDKGRLINIIGLKPAYGSCSVVTFSVRNISRNPIYVEIYPENSEGVSWKDVPCQYDIADPRSERVKRIIKNPKMTEPGTSLNILYDRCGAYERCQRARFGKTDKRANRLSIIKSDEKATSPVLQRFRVEVHMADRNSFKLSAILLSSSFVRDAHLKPTDKNTE